MFGDLPKFSVQVTDPPYSSGSTRASGRKAPPTPKYKQTETKRKYTDFLGDAMDQRSWVRWSTSWLSELRGLCLPSAYSMIFSD